MNTLLSRFHEARRVRGPGLARTVSFGVLSVTVILAALAARSDAYVTRIDGDYLYMTEGFKSVEGPLPPVGWSGNWGNGFAVNADDLWHGFTHEIRAGYSRHALRIDR